MHGLYVNTAPFYIEGLQHPKVLISVGVLGLVPPRKPRDEWPYLLRLGRFGNHISKFPNHIFPKCDFGNKIKIKPIKLPIVIFWN